MKAKSHITGIILAGGKSTRMGREKGFVMYNGKPFIRHIIDTIQPLVDEIIIVSNNENYKQFNLTLVEDIIQNAGPLAGLYSGLYHSNTENNLVLSCDVPLVNETLLSKLIQEVSDKDDVIQLTSRGKTNPLIALYKKRCMVSCLKTLESGERRLRFFVDQLKSKNIIGDQSLEKYTLNINTPNELKLLANDIEH